MSVTGRKRPDKSKYTEDLADEICDRVASGMTLKDAVAGKDGLGPLGVAVDAVRRWYYKDIEGFRQKLANATECKVMANMDKAQGLAEKAEKRADGANDKEAAMLIREALHHYHKEFQLLGKDKRPQAPKQVVNLYQLVKGAAEGSLDGGVVEVLEDKSDT